jgi:hypothetical protein
MVMQLPRDTPSDAGTRNYKAKPTAKQSHDQEITKTKHAEQRIKFTFYAARQTTKQTR